jgi:hypothetical protein
MRLQHRRRDARRAAHDALRRRGTLVVAQGPWGRGGDHLTRRWRRAAAIVLIVGTVGTVVAASESDAFADLELDNGDAPPYALARPLWVDIAGPRTMDRRAHAALRVIDREQRNGVLRGLLGMHRPRVVALGTLQTHGQTIGMSVLLSLEPARHDVTVTAHGSQVTALALRDLIVDVDLRSGAILGVAPGPASRTFAWSPPPLVPALATTATTATASRAPAMVRLSPGGPAFASYDGTRALGPAGRDWPVSLVFAGHATVPKVKRALRGVGFTHRGEQCWLAYRAPGGRVRFDGDRGVKTATDQNATDVHVRLYAPAGIDHFVDPRYGDVVAATVHLDRGESPGSPPALFGFSEEAERRVADTVANRLGWRVQRDALPLGNAEPFRHDLAAPEHIWWSDGRATLVWVP